MGFDPEAPLGWVGRLGNGLTESAAGKVKELLEQEGHDDIALRVAVEPGGCSGLRYAMYPDDQISDKDVMAEHFGVKLVLDKMSAPYVSEATIDFADTLEALGFTIDNPQAVGIRACGNSFHYPGRQPRGYACRPGVVHE